MEGFIALASFSLAYAFIVLLGLILLLNILGLPANWVVVLLVVLWKPLNWVVGIIEDFVQRRAEKGKGKGQHDGGQR